MAVPSLAKGEGDKDYHGICNTQEHVQLLKSRLADRVLAYTNAESTALRNPRYTNHMTKVLSAAAGDNTQRRGERQANARAKAQAQANAIATQRKRAGCGDDEVVVY